MHPYGRKQNSVHEQASDAYPIHLIQTTESGYATDARELHAYRLIEYIYIKFRSALGTEYHRKETKLDEIIYVMIT